MTAPTRRGRLASVSPLRAQPAQPTRSAKPTKPTKPAQAPQRSSRFLVLVALVGLLGLLGLVMVLSASAAEAQSDHGSPWYQFQRQAVWLGIGAAAMLAVLRVDYRRWRAAATPLLVVSLGLLVLVLIPSVGTSVNGSSRWLVAGPIGLQPSELAKLALVVFAADLLARRAHRAGETHLTMRPVLAVFGAIAVLLLLQPSLGTTVLLFALALLMLFVAGVPGRPLAMVLGAGVAAGGLLALFEPYRIRRLLAFSDPWSDPLNTGYQTLQSQAALANGGVTGQGLGQGRAKYGFLPEGHTDFIFSNIGEELGLLGSLLLVGIFVAIGVMGMGVALKAPDRFGMLLAAGITGWVSLQAFVNLGAAVGLLPITGVPLPFVSSGGSSLIVTMAAFGILLNVARQTDAPSPR